MTPGIPPKTLIVTVNKFNGKLTGKNKPIKRTANNAQQPNAALVPIPFKRCFCFFNPNRMFANPKTRSSWNNLTVIVSPLTKCILVHSVNMPKMKRLPQLRLFVHFTPYNKMGDHNEKAL